MKDIDPLSDAIMGASGASPAGGAKKGGAARGLGELWGENVLLLCADSLDGRRKFHQWLKKNELAIEFRCARDAELFQWIQYLAKKAGATVSRPAAELLAVVCEGSLYRLAHEIEKAWLFAGGQPGVAITEEHIAGVAASSGSHEMVELVRAILEAKRTRALLLCGKLIHGPDDALGLVGFLTWSLKNAGTGAMVGPVPGGATRRRRILRKLVELDLRLKSTGSEPAALVEQFIVEEAALPQVGK